MNNRALVLLSGGQDSVTCLAWALDRYVHVETIGFNYGQRHAVELQCRTKVLSRFRQSFPQWAPRLGDDHLLDLTLLGQLSDTALTTSREIALRKDGLPNTFVPGRNLLFFNFAAVVAFRRDLDVLVGGMCETDYSGYPDCRDSTLKALQVAINLGMNASTVIETPLMWLTKHRTWELAESLGGTELIDLIVKDTHTCYLGNREKLHAWGFGCGTCPACELRQSGYDAFTGRAHA
jgi:7-cyano-7-deazaguanine synthase